MWGSAPNWDINKIVVKQKKLLRALQGVQVIGGIPVMATDDMYKSLKMLKVKNIYQLYLFKFMIMMLNGLLPYFYEKLLRPLISNHSYNTRSNIYRQPLLTTEIDRRSFTNQLVHLHESLSPEMFVNISVKSAVRKYKKLLLLNQ